jgi:HrpA-like RNA helicase
VEDGNDDLDKYHLTSTAVAHDNEEGGNEEAEYNSGSLHVPAPIVIPSNAVRDVVQSVVNEQKRQPWLVCPEARAPTLEEDGISMHNKSDLSAEELREQQKISRNLRDDLKQKYRSAEQWETENGGNLQKKQEGGSKGQSKGRSKGGQNSPIGQQFHRMMSQRSRLPAFLMKDDIVKTIASNQITVISGDTG